MMQAIPVERKNRIRSIDTLRGIALLGILLLNIIAFSGPLASYYDPSAAGSIEGINLAVAMFVDVSSEGAFRAIFSMLFGAGVLIFFAKPEADSGVVRSLYYRRTWLLIGFGLFNAYLLLWVGDILYAYGVTGLLLYFFKDLTAKKLALSSLCLFLFLGLIHTSSYLFTRSLYNAFTDVSALPIEIEKSDDTGHLKGIVLINNKLRETLKAKGLTPIGAKKGDVFDADIHEAITQIPAENTKMKGKIIDVIEFGYKLGDKIIRYPKVVVGN